MSMVREIFADFERYWSSASAQTEKLPYWKRPDESLMTLSHEMKTSEALEIFKKYNAMTQVKLGEKTYFVTDIGAGRERLYREEIYLSSERVLYRAADGHLRLHILSGEEKK